MYIFIQLGFAQLFKDEEPREVVSMDTRIDRGANRDSRIARYSVMRSLVESIQTNGPNQSPPARALAFGGKFRAHNLPCARYTTPVVMGRDHNLRMPIRGCDVGRFDCREIRGVTAGGETPNISDVLARSNRIRVLSSVGQRELSFPHGLRTAGTLPVRRVENYFPLSEGIV